MWESVRYQAYEASDGYILLMASEQEFWRNFCRGLGRMDLFEKWPGERYADHARNNVALQSELRTICKERTVGEWLDFARQNDTTIAPFNTSTSIADDPQFRPRMGFLSAEAVGCEQLALPILVNGRSLCPPTKAPTVGEHNRSILPESPSSLAPHRSSKDEHWPRSLQGFLGAGSSRSGYR